jgi:hypothetical protein
MTLTFPQIVEIAGVVIGCACIVVQIAIGIALSPGRNVDRRTAPVHFWVIISIEGLAVLVAGLAIFAFSAPEWP